MPGFIATFLPLPACGIAPGGRQQRCAGTKKSPSGDGLFLSAKAERVYFSNASTDWGCWLAWASMAVAACWMICDRDRLEEAVA